MSVLVLWYFLRFILHDVCIYMHEGRLVPSRYLFKCLLG